MRDICNSRTYQRSTQRNESNAGDERNFAHALVRRIKAENLLDTISAVTDTKDKFDGLPLGARAVQIADGTRSTYFLKTFGRATRETPCSCEVKMEPTLSQALHLLNGDTVNDKIKQGGLIPKLMTTKKFPEERITELYIRCLSRKPTKDELAKLVPHPERRARTSPRRSRTSSGRCSTAANFCSIIDRCVRSSAVDAVHVDCAADLLIAGPG